MSTVPKPLTVDSLTLSQTFKKRAAEIADQAHNSRNALGEGAEFMRGLDETERKRRSNNERWSNSANPDKCLSLLMKAAMRFENGSRLQGRHERLMTT